MAYAVAGLATASGGAISAEAEIHYSGLIDFKFDSRLSQTHTFPLSQGAVLVGIREEVGFYEHSASFAIRGAAVSNELRESPLGSSFPYSSFLVAALPRGSVVSQGYFQRFGIGRLQYYNCGFPNWVEPGTHAIGYRFNSGRGMQYGWVRITYNGCGYPGDNKFVVRDYAWGDPGDRIKAGQKNLHEDDTQIVPQAIKKPAAAPHADSQGSLGLLALGALGLRAWRNSRQVIQS
jgi:hypothetical protein